MENLASLTQKHVANQAQVLNILVFLLVVKRLRHLQTYHVNEPFVNSVNKFRDHKADDVNEYLGSHNSQTLETKAQAAVVFCVEEADFENQEQTPDKADTL